MQRVVRLEGDPLAVPAAVELPVDLQRALGPSESTPHGVVGDPVRAHAFGLTNGRPSLRHGRRLRRGLEPPVVPNHRDGQRAHEPPRDARVDAGDLHRTLVAPLQLVAGRGERFRSQEQSVGGYAQPQPPDHDPLGAIAVLVLDHAAGEGDPAPDPRVGAQRPVEVAPARTRRGLECVHARTAVGGGDGSVVRREHGPMPHGAASQGNEPEPAVRLPATQPPHAPRQQLAARPLDDGEVPGHLQ